MSRSLFSFLFLLLTALPLHAQNGQQWRDSLATLNRQITLSPRSTDLRLKKAAVNIELEQWDYAIEEYGRVLDIDPDNLAALYFRAYALSHVLQYDRALRDYETFLGIVPRHFEARFGLAMVLKKMGRRQDTLDQLNLLVEQHPDSASAFAARASYEAELNQSEPALYDYGEAIRLRPRSVEFIAAKTELLFSLRRYDEAWDLLQQALQQGVPRAALKEWIDRCR